MGREKRERNLTRHVCLRRSLVEFWGKGGRPWRYRRVKVWIVEGSSEGRQGVRAGEKRGAEAEACSAWGWGSRAMVRGEGTDRGEARRGSPVQRAVFRVVQVICRERRKLFGRPGLVSVVCVRVWALF